jgi:hypothetical protein
MPGFGPFTSYSEALIAACPRILSMPNATVGDLRAQDVRLRWRVSREYCAWLYYTPDHQYEMSMLTDQALPDDLDRKKSCVLPSNVDDSRYARGSLKHVFALHNHPYASTLSANDMRDIVSKGLIHGFEVETKDGSVQLSVIAFFSTSSDPAKPGCDGFFQYIPLKEQLLKWSNSSSGWRCRQTGAVKWRDETEVYVEKTDLSCQGSTGDAP